MSEQHLAPGTFCRTDLDHHLEAFLASPRPSRIRRENPTRDKARRIAAFLQWTGTPGTQLANLGEPETRIDAALACPLRRLYNQSHAFEAFGVTYLRDTHVQPPRGGRTAPAKTALILVIMAFVV